MIELIATRYDGISDPKRKTCLGRLEIGKGLPARRTDRGLGGLALRLALVLDALSEVDKGWTDGTGK